MQSTACEMLGWMKHKLESRLQGEISIIWDMQMTPPYSRKQGELKSLVIKWKEESEKAGLKLNIQKTKIMTSSPITSWQIDGETMECFQIGKGVHQGCILSPCLFNLYAERIMWNAWLDEAQAGFKTAGRNTKNYQYADDTTPMAESEEELKSLLMKVKEESERAGLRLKIFKKLRSWRPLPLLHGK